MSDDNRRVETITNGGKIPCRWYAMPVAVLLLGVISLSMLAGMKMIKERQHASYALTNALMDFQIHAATAHLWLEQYTTDKKQANLDKAQSNLAEAVKLSKAIMHGGETEHGIILSPRVEPALRTKVEKINGLFSEFISLAEQRRLHPDTAGTGTAIDEHFDWIFAQLQDSLKALEEDAEVQQASDYANTTRLFYGLFIAWSLIIVAATSGLWHFESRRRQAEIKRERLVGELASVNRELDDFASIVSHDLKAPLRAIGSLAHWLASDYSDKFDERGKDQVNLLINRVRRLDSLIGCVFQYSRAGCAREEKTEVNLNSLVSNAIDMLSPPENVRIIVEDELPTIMCQSARIEQVFQNLLSNAIKFMDKPKGEIRIGCFAEGDYWKFRVTDNGPGIEKKHFEKIFRIFETLKSRDESESTGFGLALVKKIVEMYGGRVWVESEIGRGSAFYFTVKRDIKQETRRPPAMLRRGQDNNPPLDSYAHAASPAIFAATQIQYDTKKEAE
jgi:signal transduction histidine kinase